MPEFSEGRDYSADTRAEKPEPEARDFSAAQDWIRRSTEAHHPTDFVDESEMERSSETGPATEADTTPDETTDPPPQEPRLTREQALASIKSPDPWANTYGGRKSS